MNIYTNLYRSILTKWCSLESKNRNEIITKYKVFTVYGFTVKSCKFGTSCESYLLPVVNYIFQVSMKKVKNATEKERQTKFARPSTIESRKLR